MTPGELLSRARLRGLREWSALFFLTLIGVVSAAWLGRLEHLAYSALLAFTLAWLVVSDWRRQILPDLLTIPLLLIGPIVADQTGLTDPVESLAGGVLGLGVFLAIAVAFRKQSGVAGLGGGDAKLAAAAGSWLGASLLPLFVLIASATALAVALVTGKARGARIAFGPYLCVSFWGLWLWGISSGTLP